MAHLFENPIYLKPKFLKTLSDAEQSTKYNIF